MLPSIKGFNLANPPWTTFLFERVLEYYNGPRIIVQQSETGAIYLAWWTDADEAKDRWIYIPVSSTRLKDILSGTMSPLDAFEQPEFGYLFAVDRDAATDDILQIVFTKAAALPQDTLPLPEARLDISMPEELVLPSDLQTSPDQTDFGRVGRLALGATPTETIGLVTASDLTDGYDVMRGERSGMLEFVTEFREFRQIEDGWKRGNDFAPENSRLSWLSGIFSRYYPRFAVSPLTCATGESSIAVEWCRGPNVIMLDIDLSDHKGEYFSFGHDSPEEHVTDLDLDKTDTWTWLAQTVDKLARV